MKRYQNLLAVIISLVCLPVVATPDGAGTKTYNFVGQCAVEDCTGNATAQLVLQNYTLGSNITLANFVSLTYSSNLLPTVSILASDSPSVSGSLPGSLPASALVVITTSTPTSKNFVSKANGDWCAGPGCAYDHGSSGIWSQQAATTTAVPAVRTPVLVGIGLALAAMGALLLKRAHPRAAA